MLLLPLISVCFCSQEDQVNAQSYLTNFGYYNPHSFNSGDSIKNAIKDFQKFYHLKETGIVDDATKNEMAKPRCGLPDKGPGSGRRNGYFGTYSKWRTTALTYAFINTGRDLSAGTVKSIIKKAFGHWSKVTPLTFREVSGKGNINIGFHSGAHGDNSPFPRGRGGVLAHAYFPQNGRLHFDEDEQWVTSCNGGGTALEWTATHEIGHAIGLKHSNVGGTVMWPSYFCRNVLNLHQDDIAGAQSLYGKGSGTGTGGGSCSDKVNDCRKFTSYCNSSSSAWRNYMGKYCRQTCGFC